jgi:TolB-like protein
VQPDPAPDAVGVPVVAVLPFTTSQGGSWVTEGIHEDICAELTRFRALRVIAPASVVAVADRPDAEIAASIGASHVLRGRVRQSDTQIELAVALSDARTAAQVWADRLSIDDADVVRLERAVVARVVATLNARIEEAAYATALRRSASSLAAYELTVRGLKLVREGTLEADEAARTCFEQALRIDPLFPRAHAGLALSWFNEWSCQFWDRFEEASRQAYVHAHRALELDDADAMVHLVLAKMALFRSEWEQAAWYLERALFLCPNDAELLAQASVLEVYLGRPEIALAHVHAAMRLNPHHPASYHVLEGFAHVFAGQLEDALASRARTDAMPFVDAPAYVAVALAHLGRLDDARAEYRRYLAAYREKIAFGAEHAREAPREWLLANNPFRRAEDVRFLRAGFDLIESDQLPRTRPPAPAAATNRFARRGEAWVLEFRGQHARVPDLKGLHDLRRLLDHPGQELHCLDLLGREGTAGSDAVLDARARAAIEDRVRALQAELEDAESCHDLGRASRAREERDRLVDALSAALGLGGRARRLGDAAERARTTIAWRIRHALRRIEAVHAPLGRHLANSIRTGTFCTYKPEADVTWADRDETDRDETI